MQPRDPIPGSDQALILDDLEQIVALGYYVWDLVERTAIWSDGFCRLLGIPPLGGDRLAPPSGSELFFSRVHPDDRDRVRAAAERVRVDGSAPETTYRIVRPDGAIRVIRAYGAVTRNEAGRVRRVIGALVDVTEAQLASHRAAEADALLVATQTAVGVGSYVFDPATGQLEWTRTLYDVLGVDPSVKPTPDLSIRLAHPDDQAAQIDWGTRMAQGEDVPPLVSRMVRPDGSIRFLETRGRRIESDAGPRIMGVTLDVTARIELEENLRQAAKLEAVGTLAAGVAHDFNNYLAIMMLEAGSAQRALGSTGAQTLEPLRDALGRCADLTRQLLAFARRQPATLEPVDLGLHVQATARLFTRLAGPNLSVELRLPGSAIHVVGDPGQLDSIVMNLLINARDAMPEGGAVIVGLELVDVDAATASLEPGATPGPHAKLTITDAGTGIPAEALPRIFEPYFSTKEIGRGTGLGLASVYGTVKQHGGFVRIQSAAGRGSSFEVYLPPADGRAPARDAPAHEEESALSGTVLVVDDLPPLLDAAARILREVGLTVVTASSGEAALECLGREAGVGVVVTDLVMPGMGGFGLARALAVVAPKVRVVFMSGYADVTLLQRIEREAGGRPLIRKPFDRLELIRVVSDAFRELGDASPRD